MNRSQGLLYPAAVAALFICTGARAADPQVVPNEIIVKLREGAPAQVRRALAAAAGALSSAQLARVKGGELHRFHVRDAAAAFSALSGSSWVEYAEPNFLVQTSLAPNDLNYDQLWGLQNSGQTILGVPGTAGADINAEAAWDVTTGSSAIVVGVVDTGIDYNHPDLAANVWSNPGGIGGCAAGTHGFNAIAVSCNPLDDNNHGTHVSGTIGGVGNNGIGIAGINWTVSIMGLKFLDAGGSGTTANAISAIDFAVNAKIAGVNVRVLNNSWGGGGFSQALLDEINKASANDILFVAAAGNSGSNIDIVPSYPASYKADNELAVAATDNNDNLASFSNFGLLSVDLGAPGVNVLSTITSGRYAYFSGTSMATPHVTGSAALLLAAQPDLTTAQLRSAIVDNAEPNPALTGLTASGGRLNVCRSLPGCLPTH